MRIALASIEFKNNDIRFNMIKIKDAMKKASNLGVELICFGEAFLQGFDSFNWSYSNDKEIAIAQKSELIREIMCESKKLSIDVFIGYLEKDNESLYSSYGLISNDSIIHNYRRISRGWKEYSKTDDHYKEGKTPEPFKYKNKECIVALCGDLWDYKENFLLEQDILFWPIYTDFSLKEWNDSYWNEYLDYVKNIRGDILMINSICKPHGFGGCFHVSNGKIINQLHPGKESLLIIEV